MYLSKEANGDSVRHRQIDSLTECCWHEGVYLDVAEQMRRECCLAVLQVCLQCILQIGTKFIHQL